MFTITDKQESVAQNVCVFIYFIYLWDCSNAILPSSSHMHARGKEIVNTGMYYRLLDRTVLHTKY